MDIKIRTMVPEDWDEVAKIYLEGIQTGTATFQTDIPSWADWDKSHIKKCRLVAVSSNGKVAGWAALSATSSRCAYQGVAEVSIYVGKIYRKSGIGKLLLETLIKASEAEGFWTLQAGVFSNNMASLALHQTVGFRVVGIRERIGRTSDGRWQDTVLLEHRSQSVGLN